ncbi:MAG: hypothetical protein L3J62_01260 [Gammaproteobacteria bacterium]|nr:hypothetical protein [Gammaproteobacteria bacterium]MCF6229413.1 hypothetical protein [Gammaproteobacteria bacterium]
MIWVSQQRTLLLVLWLFCTVVYAEDDEALPLVLFEFIAEWQDEEGHWVDPLALAVNDEEPVAGEKDEERRDD